METIKDETIKDETNVGNAESVIKELADLKANMVSKEEYDKALADRNKFQQALIKGISVPAETSAPKSSTELRDEYADLIKKGVNNVQGFAKALELRNALVNETGNDPFMTEALTKIDPDFGERVAETLNEILDKSEGDPNMFNALLSRQVTGK